MQSRLLKPEWIKMNPLFKPPVMSMAQRAMMDWARVDHHQAILEIEFENRHLLTYYEQRFHLRACGLTCDRQKARAVLQEGSHLEILAGEAYDLPWKDESFDTVFLSLPLEREGETEMVFSEILRVLKPEGQALFSIRSKLPLLFLTGLLPEKIRRKRRNKQIAALCALEKLGFEDVSIRSVRPIHAVIIANKRKNV